MIMAILILKPKKLWGRKPNPVHCTDLYFNHIRQKEESINLSP